MKLCIRHVIGRLMGREDLCWQFKRIHGALRHWAYICMADESGLWKFEMWGHIPFLNNHPPLGQGGLDCRLPLRQGVCTPEAMPVPAFMVWGGEGACEMMVTLSPFKTFLINCRGLKSFETL